MAPLDGIRVIECGVAVAAPLAARLLAHLGAEVIKVESRTAGAASLYGAPRWAPSEVGAAGPDLAVGRNTFNSQKLGAGLELRTAAGRAVLDQLLAISDVFITNFSPPAIASLDVGPERVRSLNPQIVHIAMPGYGSGPGPYATYRSWGPNLSSFSGLDYLTGDPRHPPVMTPLPLVDYVAGYHAVVAVLTALFHRSRTGTGQSIDQSQFETAVGCLGPFVGQFVTMGRDEERRGNRSLWMAPHGVFPCRGYDRWVAIAVASDEQWRALGRVAGAPAWAGDQRFTNVQGRFAYEEELEEAISSWTRRHTAWEVAYALQSVGVAATPVQDGWDHLSDPQLEARRFWRAVRHDRLPVDLIAAPPFRFSDSHVRMERAAPSFGAANETVFTTLLGMQVKRVELLVEGGVVEPVAALPDAFGGSGGVLDRPQWRWALPLLHLTGDEPPPIGESRAGSNIQQTNCAPSTAAVALQGVRVLDLSSALSAYGTRLLADLGADVIRIEPRDGSDLRGLAPVWQGASLYQLYMDAGKRSVMLDLDRKDGREAFERMLRTADVLFESCKPGHLGSLGLGEERLAHLNPGLVHVSVTPFGLTGPFRDWDGEDLTLWALSGMLPTSGYPDAPPMMPGGLLSHYMIGAVGAGAALAGLHARLRTGRGQHVDVSGHEVLVFTGSGMLVQIDDLAPRRRVGKWALGTAPYGYFQCEDRMVCLLALFPDHWERLSRWIHEETGIDAVLDARLAGPGPRRYRYVEEVEAYINALAGKYCAGDFCAQAQDRGIPAAPLNRISDTVADPHLAAQNYWIDVDQPGLGTIRWPGAPYRLSLTPCAVRRPAPALGEHSGEIWRASA